MRSLTKALFAQAICASIISVPYAAFSQIIITTDDMLDLIGKSQEIDFVASGDIKVNVGNEGGGQIWNFSSDVGNVLKRKIDFLVPKQTVFGHNFPEADFVQKTTTNLGMTSAEVYQYFKVDKNTLQLLGRGENAPGVFKVDSSFITVAQIPIAYGSQWVETVINRSNEISSSYSVDSTVSHINVDAWGIVRFQSIDDIECLRVKRDKIKYRKEFVNNALTQTDTILSIKYTWVTKSHFIVASIESKENESNPHFTVASSFWRLASSIPTTVGENSDMNNLPTDYELEQNYPNPFNPTTSIRFALAKAGHVTLSIYNSAGQLVRTLTANDFAPGQHSVVWDARDDEGAKVASGVYLYTIKVNDFVAQKKLVLMK